MLLWYIILISTYFKKEMSIIKNMLECYFWLKLIDQNPMNFLFTRNIFPQSSAKI